MSSALPLVVLDELYLQKLILFSQAAKLVGQTGCESAEAGNPIM